MNERARERLAEQEARDAQRLVAIQAAHVHDFQQFIVDNKHGLFCSKCGETRKLEIPA